MKASNNDGVNDVECRVCVSVCVVIILLLVLMPVGTAQH